MAWRDFLPWRKAAQPDTAMQAQNSAWSGLTNPSAWLLSWAGARSTSSGLPVTPQTALSLSAYYACLRNISEDLGKLPLHVYAREQRGKRRAPEHPYYALLHHSPNEDMTAITLRETLIHHAMAYGNGYAELVRDTRGQVTAIYPIHPSRIQIHREDDGQLRYDVYGGELTLPGSTGLRLDRLRVNDVLHIKGLGAEGYQGYSVLTMAAESLGLALAAQTFGAAFYGNGSTIGAVLEHPGKLTDDAQKRLRESWQSIYGGPANAHKMAVLEEGMKYQRLGIPPDEAQFLETRQFQVREVARWFRMPPHKIGDLSDATYSNIEHQALEYVTDTLMPWAVRFEQEANRKLFGVPARGLPAGDYFCEHAFNGLLRGDQASRAAFYKELFSMGALSPNEIRQFENMNEIAGGNTYWVAANNYRPMQQVASEGLQAPALPRGNVNGSSNGHTPALPAESEDS